MILTPRGEAVLRCLGGRLPWWHDPFGPDGYVLACGLLVPYWDVVDGWDPIP